MVDVELAKNEFENFINQLEINNLKVKRKVDHTYRVSEISKKIAAQLGLTEEQINLAELIGILHDIGRFEQYKIFNKNTESKTLDNNNIFDHGEAGVKLLKKDNYLRKYIEEDKYDNVIYTSIYEHNKYEITSNLKEEMPFSKIIRDADKIDIIYEAVNIFWKEKKEILEIEKGKLSRKMKEDFYNYKLSNNLSRISETDQILRFTSFIFDMNFKCSLEMLKESDNLSKMIDRFHYQVAETSEEMKKIKQFANDYIREKTK